VVEVAETRLPLFRRVCDGSVWVTVRFGDVGDGVELAGTSVETRQLESLVGFWWRGEEIMRWIILTLNPSTPLASHQLQSS
jgi:hypothetical protein